jgi:hypothetical protein
MSNSIPSRFSAAPLVRVIPERTGGRIYALAEDLHYRTDICPPWDIVVPTGYCSDGASVPRFFWRFFPPSGQYTGAAIVHDYLCDTHLVSSKNAALIFDEAMRDLNVPGPARFAMFRAVSWFGPRFKGVA